MNIVRPARLLLALFFLGVSVVVAAAPEEDARATPPNQEVSLGDAKADDKDAATDVLASVNWGVGGGFASYPRWLGADKNKIHPVPYLNINWQDRFQFSTVDGLVIDLLHGERWHGGVVGTMMWGRSYRDLGALSASVPTRNNTLQGGVYLEYALTKALSLGWRLRHDLQSTGAAYSDIYADLDLPEIGPVEHSVKLAEEGMNQQAMRRFFGVSQETADRLAVSAYQPGAAASQYSLTYQGFIPTSLHTGFAVGAGVARLARTASQSPLVKDFGSPIQKNFFAAFVVHY